MKKKLYLGNCLEVLDTLPASKIDLIVTDPPYGINYKSGRQGIDRKKSVKREGDEYIRESYFDEINGDDEFPIAWIKKAFRVLKNNSAIYVFCHWKTYSVAEFEILSAGFNIKNCIILNKSNHGMGDLKGSFAPKYEMLIFASKGRHLLNFPDGREKDVWDVPVKYSGAKRFHPNEKPISWIIPSITNSSNKGDVVLDPFMGSGTTGMACALEDRNFIGIEMDEEYCQIARKRIEYTVANLDEMLIKYK